MEIISLTEFYAHVRVTDDAEDASAQAIVDAANSYVTGLIDPADNYDPPADVKQAALLIAGHWWDHREDTAAQQWLDSIPLNASAILVNHRSWSFGR